jgi:HAMP domain-containing protein
MSSLLGHLTIRWRLAALSGGITFLVLCGFAMIIGQLTASRIRSDFNHEVAAAVDDLRDQLELDFVSGDVVVANDIPTFAAPNRAAIRVLNAGSGRIIAQTPKAPNFGLPAIAVGRTAQVGGWRVETRRAVLKPVNTPKGATIPPVPVFVQYARKVSDVEATVDRVRLFLVLGVLVGTGLALALAAALSRRALAPIARLTATARDIGRTQDTSRRVPIPDSEDEVAELARTLDEMLRSLETSRSETEETLQRQRQFVADASHELRTPLTAVLANLELLADVLDGERGEAAHAALRRSECADSWQTCCCSRARTPSARSPTSPPSSTGSSSRRRRRSAHSPPTTS